VGGGGSRGRYFAIDRRESPRNVSDSTSRQGIAELVNDPRKNRWGFYAAIRHDNDCIPISVSRVRLGVVRDSLRWRGDDLRSAVPRAACPTTSKPIARIVLKEQPRGSSSRKLRRREFILRGRDRSNLIRLDVSRFYSSTRLRNPYEFDQLPLYRTGLSAFS